MKISLPTLLTKGNKESDSKHQQNINNYISATILITTYLQPHTERALNKTSQWPLSLNPTSFTFLYKSQETLPTRKSYAAHEFSNLSVSIDSLDAGEAWSE